VFFGVFILSTRRKLMTINTVVNVIHASAIDLSAGMLRGAEWASGSIVTEILPPKGKEVFRKLGRVAGLGADILVECRMYARAGEIKPWSRDIPPALQHRIGNLVKFYELDL
jgi:hypothetical protein